MATRCRGWWRGIVLLCGIAGLLVVSEALAGNEWRTGQTGKGQARFRQDGERLVYQGGAAFGWAVVPESIRDGFVEVRLRPVDGREDRAGGVVWRWRDANNYYVARANALEDNVVAYKVVGGRRTDLKPVGASSLAYGVKVKVPAGTWHTMRVTFQGSEFAVTFNGQPLFRIRDETFANAGSVGVWSKADSVTEFEGFQFGKPAER